MNIRIISAVSELDEIRQLFKEYANSLGIDLCFQDFDKELIDLPGKYSEPYGRLYMALINDKVAGCIALRPIDDHSSELKRLYIRNGYRGLGISKRLIQKVIDDAIDIASYLDDPQLLMYGMTKKIDEIQRNPELSSEERTTQLESYKTKLEELKKQYLSTEEQTSADAATSGTESK